jgi:hypothetical protein
MKWSIGVHLFLGALILAEAITIAQLLSLLGLL